jgi:sarcosine oxidase delta subunit
MLLLSCPICGLSADESRFRHEQDLLAAQPAHDDIADEVWCCRRGCGSWFRVRRHLKSDAVLACFALSDETEVAA